MAIIKYRESPTAEWKELPVANKVSMGYLTEEALTITGDCSSRFSNNHWNWFVEGYGDQIKTSNIYNMTNMFISSTTLKIIPFEINCSSVFSSCPAKSMFDSCSALTTLPKINNCKMSSANNFFSGCSRLREIPSDFADGIDWSYVDADIYQSSSHRNNTFYNCMSLRSFPMKFLEHDAPKVMQTAMYYYLFYNCISLDEIVGLPIPYTATWGNNMFGGMLYRCERLKNFTFALKDGAPQVVQWKNQTITFTDWMGVGVCEGNNVITYNSGITADKEVTDDASYQALKNDPDWWTRKTEYARYNHDSAVATINSLPDTSAYLAANGGTNTIKFKGAHGSKTDGGAINTLTDAEIAVAAAKGWTVTLV